MNQPWLLFLHGINADIQDHWRDPLNAALTWFGYEAFPEERILTPDYRAALRGEISGVPPTQNNWKRAFIPLFDSGREADWRRAKTQYLSRMAFLESRVRKFANATPPPLRPPDLPGIPPIPALVDDAKRYSRSDQVRAAVHNVVIQSLASVPEGSRLVIVAHSLGSVIAADLIKKLPDNLQVAVLVTIGSPLGAVAEFRSGDLDDYPFDRLQAWVNVFEPRDVVTGCKGVCEHYPWAIDVPVTLPDWIPPVVVHQHHAQYYCAHPAVAAAISGALVGSDVVRFAAEPNPSLYGLEMLLLQSLYLRELAKQLPADNDNRVVSLERARRVIAVNHAEAAALIHQQDPDVAPLPASEFLTRTDAYIRGAWDDRTLLALAIVLASAAPAPPFRIEENADSEERWLALVATLSLIRADRREPTDVDIVKAIFEARTDIRSLLAPSRTWIPTVLVAAGVLALAAGGIGLVVAAPAGLAGAALITSTLAAFGPGGMVGGMATLAALAGAGSAMAAAGAALGVNGIIRQAPNLLADALDGAIATQDPETLRSLLMSLLTLVGAQERLDFPTQRDQILLACFDAKARPALLVAAHDLIDPKSEAAKDAREMLALLEKAIRWLRGEEKPESGDAREWNKISTAYSQAMNGRTEPLKEVLAGPGRSHSEPPAIEGPGR